MKLQNAFGVNVLKILHHFLSLVHSTRTGFYLSVTSFVFPLSKTIQVHIFPQDHYPLESPTSPHTGSSHLGAVQQCCLLGDPDVSPLS